MCDRFRIQTKRLLERNRCSTFLPFNSINPNRKSVMLGLNVVDETGILAIDPHSFEEFCANSIVKIRLDDQQYLSYIDNQNDTPAFIPSPRLGSTDAVDLTLLRLYHSKVRPARILADFKAKRCPHLQYPVARSQILQQE